MLRNYFKIACRNLLRHRSYAAINIAGLSLGIACAILIFVLVSFTLSFDTFHKHKDRIYRIVTEFHDEIADYSQGVPSPLGKAFRNDLTMAEKTARVIAFSDALISVKNGNEMKKFQEPQGVAYAEPDFFNILDFPLLEGNKSTALKNPQEALITKKIAKKYFGDENNAMGKTIRLNNKTDFVITGILRDIPANTDRRQEIYLSYHNLVNQSKKFASDSSWNSIYSGSQCFVLLKPGVTPAGVNNALSEMGKKYQKGRDAKTTIFRLQPLADIHFNPDFDGYADKKFMWALSFIGLFIIVTACVNFINLATAQAFHRSTEVGVRKVLGGLRSQLFWQFMAETSLIALLAILVGCCLAALGLPLLNSLFKSEIAAHPLGNFPLLLFLFLLLLIVIFLSGSYPGILLSRFNPAQALKSKLSQQQIGGFSLRRILVVCQFTISQMLIIATIVIASQLRYSQSADLGFTKNAIVMLPLPVGDLTKMSTLRSRMQGIAGVEDISFCNAAPASESNSTTNIHFDNRPEDEHWEVNRKNADAAYLSTFGLKLVMGRNFYPSDTTREYLVNETLVKRLNLGSPENIIGKSLKINGIMGPVVGVVRDFFNASFHSEIAPICICPNYRSYANCAVKLNPAHVKSNLADLEKVWNETYPDYLYTYQFLDDRLAAFYELDEHLLKLGEGFAAIAVFIGCLGLYGLVSFMAVRKTKEIGVRKVLGAGIHDILWIFGKEFTQLLVIAFAIAAPIAGWIMHKYLQDFKYQIQISVGIFALSVGCTFLIALLAVGYPSLRAALVNPVKSLRTE